MSSINTFKVSVYGDCFDELQEKAEVEISSLLNVEISEVPSLARYELIITRDDDMGADFIYRADVIARIKSDH